jgi:putative ribosome biogenesis GTPase RsgA
VSTTSTFTPFTVCFVGGAGVGKSTLVNALVAGGDTVVTSGGVGPLTAQAIEITH